jgi:hypothetical protein
MSLFDFIRVFFVPVVIGCLALALYEWVWDLVEDWRASR